MDRKKFDIENIVYELIDRNLKRGKNFFDSNDIYENRKEYSDILSELLNESKKRIEEDREYKFNKRLKEGIEGLKEILIRHGYLDKSGNFTEKALRLYSRKIIGNIEKEIEGEFEYGKYKSKYFGREEHFFHKKYGLGDKFREIDVKKSMRDSIKRGDIIFIAEKRLEYKGGNYIILLDVSGSMINKIYEAKKSLIVLLEKIISDNNRVVLILYNDRIVFEGEVKGLSSIIDPIFKIVPNGSTDIALALRESLKYINKRSHILIITDALPTYGKNPVEETYRAVRIMRDNDCIVSVIGINLDDEGRKIAENIAKLGNGNFFLVKNLEDLGKFMLIDYYLVRDKLAN